jgi:hypothetical protein
VGTAAAHTLRERGIRRGCIGTSGREWAVRLVPRCSSDAGMGGKEGGETVALGWRESGWLHLA